MSQTVVKEVHALKRKPILSTPMMPMVLSVLDQRGKILTSYLIPQVASTLLGSHHLPRLKQLLKIQTPYLNPLIWASMQRATVEVLSLVASTMRQPLTNNSLKRLALGGQVEASLLRRVLLLQ